MALINHLLGEFNQMFQISAKYTCNHYKFSPEKGGGDCNWTWASNWNYTVILGGMVPKVILTFWH